MPTTPSKYAENQFDSATEGSFALMGEVLADTLPRIVAAAAIHPELVNVKNLLLSAEGAWSGAETVLANATAFQEGATLLFADKLLSLTRKPDSETNSLLETWDNTIRSQVAYGGSVYHSLLPNGRETLTAGTYDQQLDAIRDLGIRLSLQTTKPVLTALGTTVTAFYTTLDGLRDAQVTLKTAVAAARVDLEGVRKLAARALFSMAGIGMSLWSATPAMVDTLFDVNLLRNPAQTIPGPPLDTTWTPATRTLATTALPPGATRLEAWREGPGGMPELLAVGETGALSVQIPATITFDPGDLYQLWLQSRNSKGSSGPGPKQSWEAE